LDTERGIDNDEMLNVELGVGGNEISNVKADVNHEYQVINQGEKIRRVD
jgi:hypothetical protein